MTPEPLPVGRPATPQETLATLRRFRGEIAAVERMMRRSDVVMAVATIVGVAVNLWAAAQTPDAWASVNYAAALFIAIVGWRLQVRAYERRRKTRSLLSALDDVLNGRAAATITMTELEG